MILSFSSRHLEVFAATQDRYYDIDSDDFRRVKPGFRIAFHIRIKGKLHTWVWTRFTIRKLDYQHVG